MASLTTPPASQAARLPLTPGATISSRLSLGLLLAALFWAVAGGLLITLWLASQLLA